MAPSSDINIVELLSSTDGKITNVSLYAGLGEITRVYQPSLVEGTNKVVISGLPVGLLEESLRVDGRGPCIIHEVSISEIPAEDPKMTSGTLDGLLKSKMRIDKALLRCKRRVDSVSTYQGSLDVTHVKPSDLRESDRVIASVAEELDDLYLELEEKLEEVEAAITKERDILGHVKVDSKLRKRVAITVFTERSCEVEISLVYAVRDSTWEAAYDIYVEMDSRAKPVSLIYRAKITQNTGEAWEDVPLTLETANPVFGVSIPALTPWTLSVYRPPQLYAKTMKSMQASKPGAFGGEKNRFLKSRGGSYDTDEEQTEMETRGLDVSSKGSINATFSIPGLITVPSDGAPHTVTIVELTLDATMTWVSVPRKAAKVYLTAKITNSSDYTFLNGAASVYVDKSFISRSDVPLVSPQESFDCALGVDPSIRMTYHPRSKKSKQSGFTSKTTTQTFEQRITVHNTKSSAVTNLKVLEQFPVSESSAITVNILAPALAIPQPNKKGEYPKPEPIKINSQVSAQWDGFEDPEMDPGLLGKEGKFEWKCIVPPQGKQALLLSWEVSAPYGTNITGFDH